jgi:hypothetical protein
MADKKKQQKTVSRTQETKSGFTVLTQKQNGDPAGGKAFLFTSKESEASQVRHLHVCAIFFYF